MTQRIPQSTSKLVMFKAYLASDHATEATGKTIAITISKNGGAFGNPNAGATNATEVSSGWYKVTLDATDTNTVGPLAVRGAVATIDDVGVLLEVVKATNGGYTALPDAAPDGAGGLIISDAGGLDADALAAKAALIPGTQDGLTFAEMMVLLCAAQLGKVSGMETTTVTFRDAADMKNRIVATVDADGNRSAVTLDAT